jgi:tetratricopeptide (TPR) repeat protein
LAGLRLTQRIFVLSLLILGLGSLAISQEKVPRGKEKEAQNEYEKALVAKNYELPDEAIKYLNRALALNPRHYQSFNLLGIIYLEKKNYTEAVRALEKCVEVNPDFPNAHNNLGTAYLEMGLKDKALSEYLRAFALDGNTFAAFKLANLYFEMKELPLALDYIEKAVQKSPGEARIHNLKGVILNEMGRYREAIESFKTSWSLNPADVNVGINLGVGYMNDKQLEKAREVFEKVVPSITEPALKDRIAGYIKAINEAVK